MKTLNIVSTILMLCFASPSAVSAQTTQPPPSPPSSYEVTQGIPYTYTTFDGDAITLYPYAGRNIALLVPSPGLDGATIEQIVTVFDAAYDYYKQTTGREPERYSTHNNLGTIAVVTKTCRGEGAGCGYLGYTGIELTNSAFDILYTGVRDKNEYDQVVFYEFGRNFWFYGDKIAYKGSDSADSITTGYAVFMRFMAMEATGVTPGPFNGTNFSIFKAEVQGLLDLYLADQNLNWNNTLRIGKAPSNKLNLGSTDLFASFLFKLRDLYGDAFVQQIWKEVEKRPNAQTTQDAVDNFILAASAAAGENLTHLFVNTWRWPMSDAAKREAASRFGAPDLVVTGISWTPANLKNGSAVSFRAQIQNRGSAASPSGVIHGVAFYVDGNLVSWSDSITTGLQPGGAVTAIANGGPRGSSNWKAVTGNHIVKAYVDYTNRIVESNGTNNTYSKPIKVQ